MSLVKKPAQFHLHVSGHTPPKLSKGRTPKTHHQGRPISLATLLNTGTRPSVQLITDLWVIGGGVRESIRDWSIDVCTGHSTKVPSHTVFYPPRHPVETVSFGGYLREKNGPRRGFAVNKYGSIKNVSNTILFFYYIKMNKYLLIITIIIVCLNLICFY